MDEANALRKELQHKDEEIALLKQLLSEHQTIPDPVLNTTASVAGAKQSAFEITNAEIARYSRQLILPEIGMTGQQKLKSSSVLVVGAGGLGCPAAVYLAAAGIGKLGLVDYDEVEVSNLHRQILHTELRQDVPKSSSAAYACNQLNSSVICVPYHMSLTSENAIDLITLYDVVVDATDNVATRYLLNDACVLARKPLVSGSALRFEGQMTVYNYKGGPCYRCLYPKPPPPETVTNCSDGGVLGVVPGTIGSLQALEVMKIILDIGTTFSQKLLLFDALDGSFRTIKLRPKQKTCSVCGDSPSITRLIDYEQFCGAKASDKSKELAVLTKEDRISVKSYKDIQNKNEPHVLLDVRQPVEMDICRLPNAINIPLDKIARPESMEKLKSHIVNSGNTPSPVYVICRRGNDSQIAVRTLKDNLAELNVKIQDIRGGLTAWATEVDTSLPIY